MIAFGSLNVIFYELFIKYLISRFDLGFVGDSAVDGKGRLRVVGRAVGQRVRLQIEVAFLASSKSHN